MKLNTLLRTTSGVLALGMAAALAGCNAASSTAAESTAENASSDAASASAETSTGENAADAYAYLADFSLSAPFDENGYLTGIKASDYVTLPEDYDNLTLDVETNTVTDEDITNYIDTNILASYTTTEQVTDRAAKDGDSVNIDFVGTMDGVPFDGGDSTKSGDSGYDLTLGSGSFIAGFEDQIVGHKPGETFDVEVTFPDPYTGNPDYSGKDAVFSTTLHHINEEVTPELTDAWVKENLSESLSLDTVDALNEFVRKDMLFSQQSNAVYTQLVSTPDIVKEVPADLTKYLQDDQLYTAYQYAGMYGTDLTTFLSSNGYDSADAFLENAASSIESMGKQILIMQAAAESLDLTCDSKTLDEHFSDYFGNSDKDSYIAQYGENYLKMTTLHNIVMQKLIDDATKA